jgi:hypothetical protein
MKKLIVLMACAIFNCQVFAQIKQDRGVSGFSELKVSSAIKVILTISDKESLSLEAQSDVLSKLKSEVKGGKLSLYIEGETETNKPIVAYVNAKRMTAIEATGASNVKVTNALTESKIDLEATGASNIYAELKSNDLNVDITGASFIELKGEARQLTLDMSGAAHLKAYDLTTDIVKAKVTGASDAKINVKESIDANASGASHILYSGSPKNQSLETSGAASIKKA